jgi:hypothetical protein
MMSALSAHLRDDVGSAPKREAAIDAHPIDAHRNLDGRLEAVIDGVALGWAYDRSDPARRVEVDVLVDGELVARTIADLARETLIREGIGDGRYGFCVELPAHLQGGAHAIAAVLHVCGERLRTSTPFKTIVSTAAPEWAGATFTPDGKTDGPGRIRQRPSTQAQFSRRGASEGFSDGTNAETIVLSDRVTVERTRLASFSIQRGVADPEGERQRRLSEHGPDYLAAPLFVSRLPNALIDSGRFVICPTERQYLLDSFRHARGLVRWGYTHVEGNVYERDFDIEERQERVVVLGAQANLNYSHWLVESVVRALLFRPFDDGNVLYLTPHLKSWQREALTLAGVPEDRILMIPRRKLLRFPEIYAVSRGFSGIPALIPDAVSALAELVGSIRHGEHRRWDGAAYTAVGSSRSRRELPRRLFISRSLVKQRHISNEAELLPVLARHGFETLHPQTLSVSEQIEVFANAEAVVGSWGSGLTNLIFSPPGTIVLEMQPEQVDFGGNAFVWNIASIRGQSFAQVVCPITEGMRHLPLGERDMSVDVCEIDELLGQLLPA